MGEALLMVRLCWAGSTRNLLEVGSPPLFFSQTTCTALYCALCIVLYLGRRVALHRALQHYRVSTVPDCGGRARDLHSDAHRAGVHRD